MTVGRERGIRKRRHVTGEPVMSQMTMCMCVCVHVCMCVCVYVWQLKVSQMTIQRQR